MEILWKSHGNLYKFLLYGNFHGILFQNPLSSSGISLGYINSWVALRLVSHLWYVLVSHGE